MNTESLRIADQLRRAFAGDPWHGSPLIELLANVTAEQASARPLPSGHTIWELVVHIDVYVRVATQAVHGTPMPKLYETRQDWFTVTDQSASAWTRAKDELFQNAERLAQSIDAFADARLKDIVPGRDYDFYYLFHGIVQHSLYHGGQIALLRSAIV